MLLGYWFNIKFIKNAFYYLGYIFDGLFRVIHIADTVTSPYHLVALAFYQVYK